MLAPPGNDDVLTPWLIRYISYIYRPIHIYSQGLALTCEIPYKTLDQTHETLHIWPKTQHKTHCTLHFAFALCIWHKTHDIWAHEKALALSLWGLRIWQWSPWSLLGVYSESTRSLLGVSLERCHPSQDRTWNLHFHTRFWTSFLHHFWTKTDPKWPPKMDQNRWKIALYFGPFACTVSGTFFLQNFTKLQLENVDF